MVLSAVVMAILSSSSHHVAAELFMPHVRSWNASRLFRKRECKRGSKATYDVEAASVLQQSHGPGRLNHRSGCRTRGNKRRLYHL